MCSKRKHKYLFNINHGRRIRFCLVDGIKESFNIKVEKGYVLMRNLKNLVGTEDYLNRLELTFHQFLHLINFVSFLSTCC